MSNPALVRLRRYLESASEFYGDEYSVDRVIDRYAEVNDLTLADLREALDLAEIYEDLRNS